MTPINFITFLMSLLLVEVHYTIRRYRNSHDAANSRLPAWLHNMLYRPQPYQYARMGSQEPLQTGAWFYHTKQKKLMKMEAEEAFAMRSTVLLLMAVAVAAGTGLTWVLLRWVYRRIPGVTAY
jgi:hypothetical protein